MPELPSGTVTFLFTDVEGHTAVMDRLGDARGRALLREVELLTRAALRAHGGDEVKSLGDGVMATFLSAHAALECAVELQQALSDSSGTAEDNEELPLRIRVGINAGEPIAENDDYFGQAVIVASRVASLALGGEILVTNVVRELAAGSRLTFADRGAHLLRGLESPARIWALEWAERPDA